VGGGFSTDVGPRVRAGFENRRLNKKGHRFESDLEISKVVKEIEATYSLPLADPKVEWFSASAGFQAEDTDTSKSDQTNFGIRRAVKQAADWIRTDGLSMQFDNFAVGAEQDRSRLLIPSVAFSQKRANRPINPDRGHRLRAELRGASDAVLSTTSFLQLTVSAKLIRPLGEAGLISARLDAGTTLKEQFRELPPSVRFFAGGTESVRGYAYEALGPTDENGLVVGGSNLLTGSIEYENRFYGNFSYALFVDAGNAFDDGDIDARIGAGIGLKWRSPIGPFRVYLAHPVNFSDRSVRLHIAIGPDL
jgi:translocation and assembly module TamA